MLASFMCALTLQGAPPLRLKVGDSIRVTVAQRAATVPGPSPFDGAYVVAGDGAIYGSGFGRLLVAGKPFSEAERSIRVGLKPFVRPEFVFVRLESQRGEAVFIVGGSHPGRIPLEPGLTLRKVLPSTDLADWDIQEIELVRDGKRVTRADLGTLMRSPVPILDEPLQDGDVVSVTPTESLRVWVAGEVGRPGEVRMPKGSTLGQLIAAAGGPAGSRLDSERRLRLRRGPEEKSFAYEGGRVPNDVTIESGDLVTLGATAQLKVTVAGEAAQPGEFILDENASLFTALAKAGGPTAAGSLSSVLVLRQGEAFQVDARDPVATDKSAAGHLQNGDLVVLPRNEKRLYVLGEVKSTGVFTMEDDRVYRLADALSLAGGLSAKGVFRRLSVVRAGSDGRLKPTLYNLDEFLKDGKMEANPILKPGDAVYVGTSKGITLSGVTQAVSSLILFQALGAGQ